MFLFATAIDNIFADPHLARDALWRGGGGMSAPVTVRIVLRQPDRIASFGETRILAASTVIEVRSIEVPELSEGDRFAIDGEAFLLQGEPVRDAERLIWTAEVIRA